MAALLSWGPQSGGWGWWVMEGRGEECEKGGKRWDGGGKGEKIGER